MAAKRNKPKITRGGSTENQVLSIARVDYDDDRDGASFQVPEQKQAARRLARSGYLKLKQDTRDEVIALLTSKGLALIEARQELPRMRRTFRPPTGKDPLQLECDSLTSAVSQRRAEYHTAYEAFRSAKAEGPQSLIAKTHTALGKAAADLESANLSLEAWKQRHGRACSDGTVKP